MIFSKWVFMDWKLLIDMLKQIRNHIKMYEKNLNYKIYYIKYKYKIIKLIQLNLYNNL